MTTMSEPAPPSSKLRWLLLSVSAFLLALLLVSGFLAVRFLSEMHTQELAVTRALAERTQSLSGLWLSIQDYNQAMQQFVAQTAAEQDAAARRLDRLTLEIDADFERYPSVRDSEEDALLNGMRRVFSHQRTLYVAILSAGPEERRRQAGSMLTEHIVPAPKQILEWSGKLQAWNGERLQQADRALVSQFANLHGRLSQALAIGFGSGLLLVLGSMVYIAKLDRQTRARYVELARSQQALQQLSARLVDTQETERRAISRELHDEVGQRPSRNEGATGQSEVGGRTNLPIR
jgi:signal transduction histidine kinase